jgi:hypothetical protein
MDGARNFAIQRFAKDLLESIDNFDRALLAVPAEKLSAERTDDNKELLDLVDGLKMTERTLMNTLQKHGLERFDPSEQVEGKPQKFDPNLHEATFMAPSPNMEDGDVMYTQSKGFRLNGRVVRVSFTLLHHSCRSFLTLSFLFTGCQGRRRQERLISLLLIIMPLLLPPRLPAVLIFSSFSLSVPYIIRHDHDGDSHSVAAGCWTREKLTFLDVCLSLGSV